MYRLLLATVFACVIFSSLMSIAQERKVAMLSHQGFKDMLLASKGKVVILDFWSTR